MLYLTAHADFLYCLFSTGAALIRHTGDGRSNNMHNYLKRYTHIYLIYVTKESMAEKHVLNIILKTWWHTEQHKSLERYQRSLPAGFFDVIQILCLSSYHHRCYGKAWEIVLIRDCATEPQHDNTVLEPVCNCELAARLFRSHSSNA